MEYNIYNIDKNLAGINKISQDLKTNPKEININKTISELGTLLQNLERNVKVGFTPNVEKAMPNIGESLQELRQNFNSFSRNQVNEVHFGKLSEINERIENIEKAVSVQTIFGERFKPLKVVSLIYFCDMYVRDKNGSIAIEVKQALEQELPFIISSSMLQEKGENDTNISLNQMRETLSLQHMKFDIYQKDGLLIFIPISHLEGESEKIKLTSFDFKSDGSLKKISADKALRIHPEKVDVSKLSNLFIDKPIKDKTFYISGHGGNTTVAGMNEVQAKEIFESFLPWQRCKGLALSSCGAGGTTSALHIPDSPSKEVASFLDQEKAHLFHTIVRSLDDSIIGSGYKAEEDLKGFINVFNKLVESTKIKTAKEFGNEINALEAGKDKYFGNLIKLYSRQSAGVPGNFQLLNERKEDFPLTIHEVKAREIESKLSEGSNKATPRIVIENQKRVAVFPLVTNPTLIFEGQENPILRSMLPGNGHHFIRKIQLSTSISEKPEDYLKQTLENQAPYVAKGYFISEISNSSRTIKNAVIFTSPDKSYCIFQSNNKCYYSALEENPKIMMIDPLSFELNCLEIAYSSQPKDKSIRMASAGLETDADFKKMLDTHYLKDSIVNSLFVPNKAPLQPVDDFQQQFKDLSRMDKLVIAKFLLERDPQFVVQLIVDNKDLPVPPVPIFWSFAAKHSEINNLMDRILMDNAYFKAMVGTGNPDLIRLAISKGAIITEPIADNLLKNAPDLMYDLLITSKNLPSPPIISKIISHPPPIPRFWVYAANHSGISEFLDKIPLDDECCQGILTSGNSKLVDLAIKKGAIFNESNQKLYQELYSTPKNYNYDFDF
jgi:hypothetical protein